MVKHIHTTYAFGTTCNIIFHTGFWCQIHGCKDTVRRVLFLYIVLHKYTFRLILNRLKFDTNVK